MIRVNLVLLVAVLLSALYLVNVQYESRRLFSDLDKARSEGRKLTTERERLEVEIRGQATPLRVETLAKSRLQMRTTTPAITHYVTDALAGPKEQAASGENPSVSGSVGYSP